MNGMKKMLAHKRKLRLLLLPVLRWMHPSISGYTPANGMKRRKKKRVEYGKTTITKRKQGNDKTTSDPISAIREKTESVR